MNSYTMGRIVGYLIIFVISALLLRTAYRFQKTTDRSTSKTIGMVVLYIVGILLVIGILSSMLGTVKH